MPANFQLIPKGQTEPKNLAEIDDELCKHFGYPASKDQYFFYWFDVIGFSLACGKSFEQIRESLRENVRVCLPMNDSEMAQEMAIRIAICDYLEARYEINVWYSHH